MLSVTGANPGLLCPWGRRPRVGHDPPSLGKGPKPITCTTSFTRVLSVPVLARCSPLTFSPIHVMSANLDLLLMASPVVKRTKANNRTSSAGTARTGHGAQLKRPKRSEARPLWPRPLQPPLPTPRPSLARSGKGSNSRSYVGRPSSSLLSPGGPARNRN